MEKLWVCSGKAILFYGKSYEFVFPVKNVAFLLISLNYCLNTLSCSSIEESIRE